ncbi:MAG: aminopeptidase [Clostridiales bacterium]|nr:aminopeptidase [Clostridiales bacterium]
MSKKNDLQEKLCYKNENAFSKQTDKQKAEIFEFCEDYRKFITAAKTEREFCESAVRELEKAGFVSLESKKLLKAGDKVYTVNRGKGVMAVVIGREDITDGVNIVGAHIDSPRLDLKPNPLYEDGGMALFKTHYYGGIKKYQWTAMPLAIHGVAALADGTQIKIVVGEDEKDPVFCVSDLLPHLAVAQMSKKLSEAIPGENLNVLVGNIGCDDPDIKEGVKFAVLKLLNEKYDIVEEDLLSSEIEVVPAFGARDIGFDRSVIGGYGQDDRVCAYTALRAVMEMKEPEHTSVCLLVDKEEVGSMGATGMQSRHFENVMAKICSMCKSDYNDITLRETLSNSTCLSADVGTAFDPNYPEVSEKKNCAIFGGGLVLTKYTGSRGKGGASDACAELVAKIRRIFNDNDVKWQMGELGKVDCGGGGTIAQFVANLDIDVIDAGVPLLSMHSPFELSNKLDVFMAYKGYREFYKNN